MSQERYRTKKQTSKMCLLNSVTLRSAERKSICFICTACIKKCTLTQPNSKGLISNCTFLQIGPMIAVEVTQSRKVSFSSSWMEGASCLIIPSRWGYQGTCCHWGISSFPLGCACLNECLLALSAENGLPCGKQLIPAATRSLGNVSWMLCLGSFPAR